MAAGATSDFNEIISVENDEIVVEIVLLGFQVDISHQTPLFQADAKARQTFKLISDTQERCNQAIERKCNFGVRLRFQLGRRNSKA